MTKTEEKKALTIMGLFLVGVAVVVAVILQVTKTDSFKEVSYNNGLGTHMKLSFYKDSAVVSEAAIDSNLKASSKLMVLAAGEDHFSKARLVMYALQSSSAAVQANYKNNLYCKGLPTVFNVYDSHLKSNIKVCSFKNALYYAPIKKGSTIYVVAFTQDNNEMVADQKAAGQQASASPPSSFGLSPYNNDIKTILRSMQITN